MAEDNDKSLLLLIRLDLLQIVSAYFPKLSQFCWLKPYFQSTRYLFLYLIYYRIFTASGWVQSESAFSPAGIYARAEKVEEEKQKKETLTF